MSVLLTLMVVTKSVPTMMGRLYAAVMVDSVSIMTQELVLVNSRHYINHNNGSLSSMIIILDIDECAADTDGCDQVCTNTPGSFECSCNSGFTLSGDGRTCVEDNECTLDTDNCEQICVNTDGSFRCECNSGFVLNSDQRTCSGENLYLTAKDPWYSITVFCLHRHFLNTYIYRHCLEVL